MISTHITIDGVGPMPVERPATVAELCATVRRCADTKTAIYPVGGGTMLDFGLPPARPGIALSTTALDQVIDYPARDLTITVQAGITAKELQATLANENQWLPIDIPETATIGGAIACDVSGPRRYGYGTLRDYVIGITIVNDCGEETHAGGRVVKNVAGYDFMKLHTGALGTLGVITQVTLKVKPKPERIADVHFSCDLMTAKTIFDQLGTRETRMYCWHFQPKFFTLARPRTEVPGQQAGWKMGFEFAGQSDAVQTEASQIVAELTRVGIPISRIKVQQFDSVNAEARPAATDGNATLRIRVRVLPSETIEACSALYSQAPQIGFETDLGSGLIIVWGSSDTNCEIANGLLKIARSQIESSNGVLRVDRCPTEWKKSLSVWGRPPADLALQKAVKRALDPQNLFNPGRFVTDAF